MNRSKRVENADEASSGLDEAPAGNTFLNPRVVGTFIVAILVINIVWAMVEAWLPPSPAAYASHSYSGRVPGYRGLYDLLTTFRVPVVRWQEAPPRLFQGHRRILLLDPDMRMIETEKAYQPVMADWVRAGGQLVVVGRTLEFLGTDAYSDAKAEKDDEDTSAPPTEKDNKGPVERRGLSREERLHEIIGRDEFLESLGIRGIKVEPWASTDHDTDRPEDFEKAVEEAWGGLPSPERYVEPVFSGSLAPLGDGIKRLMVPEEDLSWFDGPGVDDAVGRIDIEGKDSKALPVALAFRVGEGDVVLVSEPVLFNNSGLGTAQGGPQTRADNAVLAYRLAVGDGTREVAIDEFYHGALHSLGPLALVAIRPYRTLAISILLATLLWAWAYGVRFGPPLAPPRENRRNILEYVSAMARLFRRGGKQRFVLQTNRQGLMDEVRSDLFMPLGTPEHLVLRRLAQSDREAAEHLESVLREVDHSLGSPNSLTVRHLMELQKRLESCRIPESLNRLHQALPHPTRSPRSTVERSTK